MCGDPQSVVDVGCSKQLFVDRRFIEQERGITLTLNPPLKVGPVMKAETPIERACISGWTTVLEADGRYLMYYAAVPEFLKLVGGEGFMQCLATSGDGVHWKRENVNLFDVGGLRENNVVIPGRGTVFLDPKENNGCRFWWVSEEMVEGDWWKQSKITIKGYLSGIHLCSSKDGIQWQRWSEAALPFKCDTMNQVFYDARLNKYVVYTRGAKPAKGSEGQPFSGWTTSSYRTAVRTETERLLDLPWPHGKPNPLGVTQHYHMITDELPSVLEMDEDDPCQTDVYTPCVHQYPWATDVYFAFPSLMRDYRGFESYGRDPRGTLGRDGPLEIACAVSRDGVNWSRFRQPYVGLGRIGEHDGGSNYMGLGMLHRGDDIYMYYAANSSTHNPQGTQGEHVSAICCVVQRLDGFVSVDAGAAGGELTTPLLTFSGNRLQLNIDCSALGEAWVEMLDEGGFPISGYTMEEAVSIDRNGVAQEVWWRNGPEVSSLSGRPIRLRIKLRSAKLYAFQFVEVR